jgi:hypothetical protein
MASKLLASLVAGSLILSPSLVAAQTGGAALEPAAETGLGSKGESRLGEGGDVDTVTAILFGLIVFAIAVWVSGQDDDSTAVGTPTSP